MPDTPTLTVELAKAELHLSLRIEKAKIMITGAKLYSPKISQDNFFSWHEYNLTLLDSIFSNSTIRREYSRQLVFLREHRVPECADEVVENIESAVRRLNSIIARLSLYKPDTSANQNYRNIDIINSSNSHSRDVFVVHGRSNEMKETVARFLEKLELKPIILHEQPSAGQTIIEKFEKYSDARFAIVLLTPDDVGSLAQDSELRSRARQNVIFEWGFFVGKLGRKNVCALIGEGLEKPSDMDGILCIPADSEQAWKMRLVQELKVAGIEVDLNQAFS